MNSESLKTFVTLAEVKNYRKAAQTLYITQSTVTKRIQELENSIGQLLFYKEKRPIELTPAGIILLKYAREMLLAEEQTLLEIQRTKNAVGFLNIGCVNSLFDGHVAEKIEQKQHYVACHII